MNLNDEALKHSGACVALLDAETLKDALSYCASQGIGPPQCSLTANSANANNLRIKAMNHLADYGWWLKRLKIKASRMLKCSVFNNCVRDRKTMETSTAERYEASARFFDYAIEYLEKFFQSNSNDKSLRYMEHFLIFLSAAIQNFKPDCAEPPNINLFEGDEQWLQVCWVWEARNSVAHRYLKFHSTTAVLMMGGFESEYIVNGFFFLPIVGRKTKKGQVTINAPKENALVVCQQVLEFWRFAFDHVASNAGDPCVFDCEQMWKTYKYR